MVLIEAFHSSRDITLVEPFDWKPIQGHFILAFHWPWITSPLVFGQCW